MNIKKNLFLRVSWLVPVLIISSIQVFAQQVAATDSTAASQPVQIPKAFFEPLTYLWIFLVLIVIVTLMTLNRAVHALTRILVERTSGTTMHSVSSSEYISHETTWSKIMRKMTRSVPVEREADVMLDHNYDGIRELDNQLPPWWKWGFILTILFAIVYIVNYHIAGSGKLQSAEYNEEVNAAILAKEYRMKNSPSGITATSVVLLTDQESMADGKTTFISLCAACHGQQGQGMVGPNLTDEFWIHGGGIKNLFNTITVGVPDKGMISWKNQLSPKQIQTVASYILSLQGSKPVGAKDPQGDKWVEPAVNTPLDSAAVAKDSVAVQKG